jgi:hypothetical protein
MNDKPVTNPMLDLSYIRDDDVDFFGIDLADEKSFRLFIKLTEGLCRRTIEYQLWAKRTKMLAHEQNEDPDKDDSSFCPICGLSYEYVDPESHHHPITLFNLCVNTFQSWIDENELRNKQPLDLVYDVMQLHAMGKVEHVVLCKHCHEKYHNGLFEVKEAVDKIITFKRGRQEAEDKASMPEPLFLAKQKKKERSQALRNASYQRKVNLFGNVQQEELDKEKSELLKSLSEFVEEVTQPTELSDLLEHNK